MRYNKFLIIPGLIVSGFLSLWVKANGQVFNVEPDRMAGQKRIVSFMENNDLALVKKIPMTLQGEFFAQVFVGKKCASGLLAVPLHRNAEGEFLVKALTRNGQEITQARTIFIYGGQIYNAFPSFAFWLGESLHSFRTMFNSNEQEAGMVLSVTLGKTCILPETLKWRSF